MLSSDTIKQTPTYASVMGFLTTTLKSYTEITDITSETSIETAGIDSFDFVEILFKIEDEYGIDLDFNANFQFNEMKTVGDLARQIVAVTNRKVAA